MDHNFTCSSKFFLDVNIKQGQILVFIGMYMSVTVLTRVSHLSTTGIFVVGTGLCRVKCSAASLASIY